jgi:hypothetical protein
VLFGSRGRCDKHLFGLLKIREGGLLVSGDAFVISRVYSLCDRFCLVTGGLVGLTLGNEFFLEFSRSCQL